MVYESSIELDDVVILILVCLIFISNIFLLRTLKSLDTRYQVLLTQFEILLKAVTTRQNRVKVNARSDALPQRERAKTTSRDYKTTTENPGRIGEVKSERRDGSRRESSGS